VDTLESIGNWSIAEHVPHRAAMAKRAQADEDAVDQEHVGRERLQHGAPSSGREDMLAERGRAP
jgi:hypothetical protein